MSQPNTTKAGRAILKAIRPVVDAAGARCWVEGATSGGHPKLVIDLGGASRTTPLSNTPRLIDQAVKHKLADVRRLLAEMAGA